MALLVVIIVLGHFLLRTLDERKKERLKE